MEYFKYNSSFLNTLNFTTSSYADLDNYLNGVVKNYLNHNYSFLDVAPTPEELSNLKIDIEASYDLMLGDVKPRYVEMLRLSTQQEFETVDEVVSEYGNETQTGSYYEPKVNSAQAQINTNGNLTSWDDDTTTTTRTEHRVLSESAIKDFFKEIKEEVELYFIDYVNLFADGQPTCEHEFSQEQLEAINSGINATKVAQIQTNKENIETLADAVIDLGNNKQDKLSTAQLDAVNSGIDATLVSKLNGIEAGAQVNTVNSVNAKTGAVVLDADDIDDTNTTHKFATANELSQITTNQNNITTINGKIPSQASDTNQLADKNFVNSSIATNTANFIGTFNSVADLNAYAGTKTNNDYAFVIGTDGDGNTTYNRYKWNGSAWVYEYTLNNSSFTANQWATINSGVTSADVTKLNGIESGAQVNTITSVNSKTGAVVLDASDVGALASGDNVSELVNDAGYLTSVDISNKAEVDASNLSSANVTSWKDKLLFEQVETIYDKDSADSNINWGYTNGIDSGTTKNIDLSKYKYLRVTIASYVSSVVYFVNLKTKDLSNIYTGGGTICTTDSGLGALIIFGKAEVNSAKSSIKVSSGFLRTNNNTITNTYKTTRIDGIF